MNNGKTKFRNTALLMQKALFQLLNKKDFSEISVAEICKGAGVNRSTFYSHYQNTFDLLKEAVDNSISDFYLELGSLGENPNIIQTDGDFFVSQKYLFPYLKFIKKNKLMFKAYNSNVHLFPINDFDEKLIKNVFTPICRKNGVSDDGIIRYMSKYFLAGITAIVAEWVKNDCKDDIRFVAEVIIFCVRPRKQ